LKATQTRFAITCEGLFKTYAAPQGPVPVLDGVHLNVARGEFVSLLGPSGGGKSTLLNILAGLDHPDQGRVEVLGDPASLSPSMAQHPAAHPNATESGSRHPAAHPNATESGSRHPAARGSGSRHPAAYMQQKDLLLPWRTLWENILLASELGPGARWGREGAGAKTSPMEAEARALVREFGLEGFESTYPAQLSGGMRQRAALIRTLLCHRDVMLLDEPFGALDALTRSKLQQMLLEVWRRFGKTIVLVTHDVEEAVLLSDRIVLLSGLPGRVAGEFIVPHPHAVRRESPETLRLKNRILRQLEADATPT